MEESNISSDNNFNNINEYKKVFNASTLDSENESQYYDLLKRYNENDNDDFQSKDPFMDHNNNIEINTTENKKDNRRNKTDEIMESPKRKKNHVKKESKRSNNNSRKREDSGIKRLSSKHKGYSNPSSPKKKGKEKHKKYYSDDKQIIKDKFNNNNNNNYNNNNYNNDSSINNNETNSFKHLYPTERQYNADISLNSSLNSSDTSINKIIQMSLNEYSKDINKLINKDKENELKREMDVDSNKKQENNNKSKSSIKNSEFSSKPLISNNLNDKLKELIDKNIDNMNNNIIGKSNDIELNNKILFIDKLLEKYKEKEDQLKQSKSFLSSDININTDDQILHNNIKNNYKFNNEEISIETKCPFYSNGCNWHNTQNKLSDHLLYECKFCPNIITNSFVNLNKKSKDIDNKNDKLEKLDDKLSKLSISNNDDEKFIDISLNDSKDELNQIFSNYLNEEEKPGKVKSTHDLQDGLFDQIIQDYNYTNDNSSSHLFKEKHHQVDENKLTLDTNLDFNKDDLPSTGELNFIDEPLTWDINSDGDNSVPWSKSPVSASIKERKKYKLSNDNDKVSVKNKKSPTKEVYAGKKLLHKYQNLISSFENPSIDFFDIKSNNSNTKESDIWKSSNTNNNSNSNSNSNSNNNGNSNSNVFDPNKPFRFELPSDYRYTIPLAPPAPAEPLKQNEHNITKELNDITLSVNTQLNNKSDNNIYSMFTPREIEVLMDIWFKNEGNNRTGSESNLIFSKSETSFIKDLLSSIDEETKNNLREYKYHKLGESRSLLSSIDNLLSIRRKYNNPSMNSLANLSFNKFNFNFSNDFSFDFNFDKMNKSREFNNKTSITKDLNKAFKIQKEQSKKTYTKFEIMKNKFKYMIICWLIKLFENNNIYTICWKFINTLKKWITYIKNKLVQKAIETSKMFDKRYKKLQEEKKKIHEKEKEIHEEEKELLEEERKLHEEEKEIQEEEKDLHKEERKLNEEDEELHEKDEEFHEEKKNIHTHLKQKPKESIIEYIDRALSNNDSSNNLLMNWNPVKKNLKEEEILMKKKKFSKTQEQIYRAHQYEMKYNQDRHTLYTNFLDYQNARGFKSLTIQNNIRKKIKMMQTINELKHLKMKSITSPSNKYKKRKVEIEKKERKSLTSYFNDSLNLLMNILTSNSKPKNQISDDTEFKQKIHIFGAEANIDFNKHTLIIYNKKTSELNYIPKNKNNVVKKAVRLNEFDQLIIYNNDESGWINILSSKPISNNMDLFYFEVKVNSSKPNKKYLYSWSIGFSTSKVQLSRYPERPYSWDYYNTGNINKNNSLEKYGEPYVMDDIIGCGINFKNNLAFFTRNGKFLGDAVRNFLTDDLQLYINIGLFNYAKIETNFGAKKFRFNIESYFYNKRH
ncbi:hypothetical protein H8356DRAFT_1021633 [Neocallimastix lanati (nom. inval.)]|nr:hypothetical protein H8356DRAFT_1021633 [Neocallimastix sp. JGI-2020a]